MVTKSMYAAPAPWTAVAMLASSAPPSPSACWPVRSGSNTTRAPCRGCCRARPVDVDQALTNAPRLPVLAQGPRIYEAGLGAYLAYSSGERISNAATTRLTPSTRLAARLAASASSALTLPNR